MARMLPAPENRFTDPFAVGIVAGVFPIGPLFHGAAGVALLSPIWRPLLDKATGAPVKTRSGRKSRTPKRYQ